MTVESIIGKAAFVKHGIEKDYMHWEYKVHGVKDKKAVFISFQGKSYSDNPRAISEKLHELNPEFEIVWLFIRPDEKRKIVPGYVKCVEAVSSEALKELATAKFWVDNFTKPIFLHKGKDQVYIQTGHGDRCFKKVYYDVRTLMPDGHYKEGDLLEPEICDLAVSGSGFMNRLYKTAFGYEGQILTCGSPRNDQLLSIDKNKTESVREALKIDPGTKVLMYAPTFRDSKLGEAQKFNGKALAEVLSALEEKTGDRWICFVRAHSAASGFEKQKNDRVIDVTSFEDMAELLLITDMLITDYSSSAGDFALLERPIILLQNDREEYASSDRAFYFDIDESPFIVVRSWAGLIDKIKEMDMAEVPQNCRDILKFYGTVETGKSSEAVVNYIISKLQ
jgi:CDP-glycerol glycerophosphotransferase